MTTSPDPRSDHDTHDIVDDALTELAARRAAWLGDDLTVIALLASLIDQAERCLPEHVHAARENGHSWHEIAQILSTSPEEVQLRFDPRSPVADTRWPYDT
jgi:AhpD family alkylhydroperoxidase